MEDLHRVFEEGWGAPMGAWRLVRGGRVLCDEKEELYTEVIFMYAFAVYEGGGGRCGTLRGIVGTQVGEGGGGTDAGKDDGDDAAAA